jgi:hypothetical protein
MQKGGRIISTGSGGASMYVSNARGGGIVSPEERKRVLTNPKVTIKELDQIMEAELQEDSGSQVAYGCSKVRL